MADPSVIPSAAAWSRVSRVVRDAESVPRQGRGNRRGGAIPRDTLFVVSLDPDGGDDGDATTAPTYTYTATDDSGFTFGTGLSPETGRSIGSFNPAVEGLLYKNSDGDWALFSADEQENTVVCGT